AVRRVSRVQGVAVADVVDAQVIRTRLEGAGNTRAETGRRTRVALAGRRVVRRDDRTGAVEQVQLHVQVAAARRRARGGGVVARGSDIDAVHVGVRLSRDDARHRRADGERGSVRNRVAGLVGAQCETVRVDDRVVVFLVVRVGVLALAPLAD